MGLSTEGEQGDETFNVSRYILAVIVITTEHFFASLFQKINRGIKVLMKWN